MVKVAAVQMDIVLGDKSANLKNAVSLIEEAGKNGAEIVCLPEIFNTGLVFEKMAELSEEENGETLNLLRDTAKKQKVNIITGSFPLKSKDEIFNTAYIISSEGKIIGSYRKLHLFSPIGEDKHFKSGNTVEVFKCGQLNIGLMICYDIRFPELARSLALKGANILFVPAQFPNPRLEHWKVLLKARAIENQLYIVGVNRVGFDASRTYFGHSMIIDPVGSVVSEAEEEQKIIYADIDLDNIKKIRELIPCFKDRRIVP